MDPSAFEAVLEGMNAQGRFAASVLASDDGLPVAFAPSPCPYDANTVAAMVSLVKGFMQQTQQQLGLADVEEVSTIVSDRTRLTAAISASETSVLSWRSLPSLIRVTAACRRAQSGNSETCGATRKLAG